MIAKAALLHDIGKLCFRAGLTDDAANYPQFGAKWLAQFADETDENAQQLLRCVAFHRRQDFTGAGLAKNDLAYIIYLADTVAFGAERMERQNSKFNASLCLESVFNYFSDNDTYKRYFLPKDMSAAREINYAVRDDITACADDYKKILKIIENKLKQKSLMQMYPYELMQLFEDTLYYLPLTVREDLPRDISLFEHVKLTSALAVSIAQYFEAEGITDYAAVCTVESLEKMQDEPVFLMVSADITGIYGFLTTPASQAPLGGMHGRSLYLEYFSQILAEELAYLFNLSRCNVIFAGGGHLYVIAPNTAFVRERIAGFEAYVNEWLLKNLGTQLYVAFGYTECTSAEFVGRRLGSDIFARVDLQVENNKKNRYSAGVLEDLFNPESFINQSSDAVECCMCHRPITAGDVGRKDGLCQFCRSLQDLGRASFIDDRVLAVCSNHAAGSAAMPGYLRPIYLKLVAAKDLEKFKAHNKVLRLYSAKGGTDEKCPFLRLSRCDYFAKDTKTGKVLDMEQLAARSMGETYTGVKRLGVLMADIDAIGMVLKAGFYRKDLPNPLQYLTFTRQAAMSGRLAFFFKVILNKIFRGDVQAASGKGQPLFRLFNRPKQFWRNLHVIYSGGDNIFLLGAWDDVVEAAVDIYHAFAAYTNNKLAFSAGIGMFTPDYPMEQMFIQAELLKKAAKNVPGTGKIALFGQGADYVTGPGGGLAHVYDWEVFEKAVCGEKLRFLTEKLSFGAAAVPGRLKADRTVLYKLHSVLAEPGGRFNLAAFAYAVALLKPKQDDADADAVYAEFSRVLYNWCLEPQGRRQLLTALELLIYSLPNVPKEDF